MAHDSETVTAEGTFEPSDYWRANKYLQNRMPRVWFVRAFLLVMPWLIILYEYQKDPTNWSWWILLVPLLFVIVVFVLMPFIDRGFLVRRMSSNPSAFGHKSYSFSDQGIEINGTNENVQLNWAGIIRASESPSDFFLFVGANTAQFVPKRFLSESDQEALRAVLRQRLANKTNI